jgi:16S rRNA processing protein RimM
MDIADSRPHQAAVAVKFEEVDDRAAAETLRDRLIFVAPSALEALEEDAYWEHELVGLDVVDSHGLRLGHLTEVLSRPEQDLWKVETQSGPVLFPAAKELVLAVDLEAGEVVVNPPDGMFASPDEGP